MPKKKPAAKYPSWDKPRPHVKPRRKIALDETEMLAQDAAAGALGLCWASWARDVLNRAAKRAARAAVEGGTP